MKEEIKSAAHLHLAPYLYLVSFGIHKESLIHVLQINVNFPDNVGQGFEVQDNTIHNVRKKE